MPMRSQSQKPGEERVGVWHPGFNHIARSCKGEFQECIVVFQGEKQVLRVRHGHLELGLQELHCLVDDLVSTWFRHGARGGLNRGGGREGEEKERKKEKLHFVAFFRYLLLFPPTAFQP